METAKALRKRGWSLRKIAHILGVSHDKVRREVGPGYPKNVKRGAPVKPTKCPRCGRLCKSWSAAEVHCVGKRAKT